MPDAIRIEQLELSCFIGVPDAERAAPQRLTVSLVLEPLRGFQGLGDDIAQTVDYFTVCEVVKTLSLDHPRRLIETLAEEIATTLLSRFPLAAVEVELRKFILPDTAFVAVRLRRERQASLS